MKKSNLPRMMPPSEPAEKRRFLFEDALLIFVLAVTALRATFIEITYQSAPNPMLPLPAEVLSILLSSVLIGAFCVWLAVRLLRPVVEPIAGGIGLAVSVFLMAAAAAVWTASHQRDAVTYLVTLGAPLLTLLMLTDLLRKPGRLIPALWVLLALGAAATYHCYEQARVDNESVIRDYERDPQRILRQVGIEPGTLKHWQFEHRLRSKDVRGFLTTSNSTGSFLLLGLFAALGLLVLTWRGVKSPGRPVLLIVYGALVLILFSGLVLCRSRGAIGAGAISLLGWLVCVCWGKSLRPYRKYLLLAGILAAAVIAGGVIHYGRTHGRLPGPNAMLVRWQYWESTARLIADHPWLGVGGGNFTIAYPLYKNPAAPEMIRDPHNFFLSVASACGLLGALAFTLVWLGPLLRMILRDRPDDNATAEPVVPSLGTASMLLLVIAVVLLMLRPLVAEGTVSESNPAVLRAYYVVYYLVPAGVVVLVLGLLMLAGREPISPAEVRRGLLPALGWGVGAVLIHNLIDFAIFETAVLMALTIFLAGIAALDEPARSAVRRRRSVRLLALGLLTALFAVYLWIAVIPPVRAGAAIRQAFREPDQALALLDQAHRADPLSPQAARLRGQWLMRRFDEKILKDPALLDRAAAALQAAIRRNPDDYRLRETLADVYYRRAETADRPPEKTDFLKQAYTAAYQAWQRYPGSDRITFKLGTIAEQLGRMEKAAEWYCRAVAIEEAYRKQFREMYPEHELFSRLGSQRYEYARQFIQNADARTEPEAAQVRPQDPNSPHPSN